MKNISQKQERRIHVLSNHLFDSNLENNSKNNNNNNNNIDLHFFNDKKNFNYEKNNLFIQPNNCISSTDNTTKQSSQSDSIVQEHQEELDGKLKFDLYKNGIVVMEICRPKALNALSNEMFPVVRSKLNELASDERVHALVVIGSGNKAFCAGGDVKQLRNFIVNDQSSAKGFIENEYKMNQFIHRFPKPYISIWNGIVMGGGVGISLHGRYRIATEKTTWAMPECGIGLFPDVGSCYFLSRAAHGVGLFAALTGYRFSGPDAVRAGLASHYINSCDVPKLMETLKTADIRRGNIAIDRILRRFTRLANSTSPSLNKIPHLLKPIEQCFGEHVKGVEEVRERLCYFVPQDQAEKDWKQFCLRGIDAACPISLKVTFEQQRRACHLNIDECLRMDYRIGNGIISSTYPMFVEGVRALLIDKDHKPRWNPDSLSNISSKLIAHFFEPPENGDLSFE